MKIDKKTRKRTKINVGFYIEPEINNAMLAAAEENSVSRNDVLTALVERGLKEFIGKKPKMMKEKWMQYED